MKLSRSLAGGGDYARVTPIPQTHTHTHTHSNTQTHTHTLKHTATHTHTHTQTHRHTHTRRNQESRTQSLSRSFSHTHTHTLLETWLKRQKKTSVLCLLQTCQHVRILRTWHAFRHQSTLVRVDALKVRITLNNTLPFFSGFNLQSLSVSSRQGVHG